MADTLQIPKFREKIIYWKTAESKTEVSYPISASYRGILRLSPNDDGSLRETTTLETFDGGASTAYRDSIDPAITQQFICISTSDGYFVNLRINQYDIESDNLYIIGPSKHDLLRVYARAANAVTLKSVTALPAKVNVNTSALIGSEDKIGVDITGYNTHDPLDQSYLAVSRVVPQRQFTFEQTTQLIRDLVIECLLDLQTIPTGSIHYVPITIHAYEAMLMRGHPNEYFLTDKVTPNDSIIRDYLVCDGSLYNNDDFPELAKILEGVRVDYWKFEPSKNRMVQQTHINDYTTTRCFRVPDLRCKFLRSLFLRKQDIGEHNETGAYTCDSLPNHNDEETEIHTHFVTSSFYQATPNNQTYTPVATIDPDTKVWSISDKPGVLCPENKDQERAVGCFGSDYNVHRYSGGCIKQPCHYNLSGYFLSIPYDFDFLKRNYTANVGLSSEELPACKIMPDSDADVSYNDRTDYAPYTGTGAMQSYGKENVPENFCALPLIRI